MDITIEIEKYKNEGGIEHLKVTQNHYAGLSLREAINQAALGLVPGKNGRLVMHNHQCWLGRERCENARKELVQCEKGFKKCQSFEEIFKITEKVKNYVGGVGDLWSYDAALRIAFNKRKKRFLPKDIYIQCGVVNGVRMVLGEEYNRERNLPFKAFINKNQNFLNLTPYQAENFLCLLGRAERIGMTYRCN